MKVIYDAPASKPRTLASVPHGTAVVLDDSGDTLIVVRDNPSVTMLGHKPLSGNVIGLNLTNGTLYTYNMDRPVRAIIDEMRVTGSHR